MNRKVTAREICESIATSPAIKLIVGLLSIAMNPAIKLMVRLIGEVTRPGING